MTKLNIRWSTSVRIALALAIAVVNAALFATSTSAAVALACGQSCVEHEGGALGFYVDCESGGDMATCRPRLTDCVGYPCPSAEASAEVVFEPLPAELPGN